MIDGSRDRLDRIEQILEGLAQNQGQIIQNQQQIIQSQGQIVQSQRLQQEQIQALVNAVTHHEAIISRLDAILERLIYREGRGNGDHPQP